MGTKNNPGEFDCYANAEPDEPIFILLGRDPVASIVIRIWVSLRDKYYGDSISDDDLNKRFEALQTADIFEEWAKTKGKDIIKAKESFRDYAKCPTIDYIADVKNIEND